MKHVSPLVKLAVAFALVGLPAGATSLTTAFTGINGFSGNMFSATVTNSLTITSLDVNVSAGAETIQVYEKIGTYVGFEQTSAAWTLESTTTISGLGQGLFTPVTVTPFSLLAGNMYSLYVTLTTTTPTMYYSNGDATYANADLSLSLGEGLGGLFGAGGVFPSRTWNGSITYDLIGNTAAAPEPSSLSLLAAAVPTLLFLRRKLNRGSR